MVGGIIGSETKYFYFGKYRVKQYWRVLQIFVFAVIEQLFETNRNTI